MESFHCDVKGVTVFTSSLARFWSFCSCLEVTLSGSTLKEHVAGLTLQQGQIYSLLDEHARTGQNLS